LDMHETGLKFLKNDIIDTIFKGHCPMRHPRLD
jgi:hypothetical protein